MTSKRIQLQGGDTCEIVFCTRCISVHIYVIDRLAVLDWTPVSGLETVQNGGTPFKYLERVRLAKEAMQIWEEGGKAFREKLRKQTNNEVNSLVQQTIRKALDR